MWYFEIVCITLVYYDFVHFKYVFLNLLAQQIGQTGPHCTLRFLKANCIKETSVLGRSQDILDLKDLVIDVESLKAREEAAIRCLTLPI